MNVQLRSLSNYLASSPATLLQCSVSAIQSLWYDFTVERKKKKEPRIGNLHSFLLQLHDILLFHCHSAFQLLLHSYSALFKSAI